MNDWDRYFLDICKTVSQNSKCLSRKIGAILVKDKSILSTGYNGPPRGIPHCGYQRVMTDNVLCSKLIKVFPKEECGGLLQCSEIDYTCPRQLLMYKSGEGLDICIASHAERNVLINAAKNGVSTDGGTLYMNCNIPCKDCLIEIINAGIKELVVVEYSFYDSMSKFLLEHSGIDVRTFGNKLVIKDMTDEDGYFGYFNTEGNQ